MVGEQWRKRLVLLCYQLNSISPISGSANCKGRVQKSACGKNPQRVQGRQSLLQTQALTWGNQVSFT